MFEDITKPPKPLPTPQLKVIRPGISLLPPLSRRGHGPGLIVITPDSQDPLKIQDGVPSVLVKWAEEGYTVVQIELSVFEETNSQPVIREALQALLECDKLDKGSIGLVVYSSELWNTVAPGLAGIADFSAAVVYTDSGSSSGLFDANLPLLRHVAGPATTKDTKDRASRNYYYPKAQSVAFATPFHEHFDYNMESVSHTRNLQFLKPLMKGPYFDLEYIWEEHTHYEFADRSVEHTMSTMVQEPYVNHIPTVGNALYDPCLNANGSL
ncbi:hypothetical protein ACHAPJ_010170 [Fusarium lateritium]